MIQVLLESNWVFDYCAPKHRRESGAESLLDHAASGLAALSIPAFCLLEGADSVRRKCQPRADELHNFWRVCRTDNLLSREGEDEVRRFLELYRKDVSRQLLQIDERLDALSHTAGVEVFALNDAMLERAIRLRHVREADQLKPFDQAVLAAVLVRAEELASRGHTDVRFCTTDSDLWPWTKRGDERPALLRMYTEANVKVQPDFSLATI